MCEVGFFEKLGNYLRVRGEYSRDSSDFTPWQELPPRARRILRSKEGAIDSIGTTSACAENTPCLGGRLSAPWNYLRVRGEYAWVALKELEIEELPPRARRILL